MDDNTVKGGNAFPREISWDTPSDAPDDYPVTWKKSDGKWTSFKKANTVQGGNAFPTGTSHTVTRCRTWRRERIPTRAGTACGCAPVTTTATITSRRAVPGPTRSRTRSPSRLAPPPDPPVEVTVSSQLPSAALQNRSHKEQVPPRKSKKSPPLHDNLVEEVVL